MSEIFKPKKIAILGGGIASLTTAYELTSQPGWDSLYDITIYQTGWRLGGKCATGRNIKPHAPDYEPDYRIEEHGLHIFFGFYENAFRLLKQCYDELGGNGPFSTIEDAFKPHSFIVLEEYINQNWVTLPFNFPTNSLVPWEGGDISSLWEHICSTIKFVIQTYAEIDNYEQSYAFKSSSPSIAKQIALGKEVIEFFSDSSLLQFPSQLIQLFFQEPSFWGKWLNNINQYIGEILQYLDFNSEGMFLKLAYNLAQSLPQNIKTHRREHHQLILKLIDRFKEHLSHQLESKSGQNPDIFWRLTLIDLALANIRGLFVDEVIHFRSLDSLDEYNYIDWLRKHGARESSVKSAFIRVLYDLVYGFPEGNTNEPQLAAGTAIRILTTMLFKYNGAIMWKMQSGMAEVVITPLYEVLKRRGVKFKFFHVAKQLHFLKQMVIELVQTQDNTSYLEGESFNESVMQIMAGNITAIFYAYLAKSILSYFFKDYGQSVKNAQLAEQYEVAASGTAYLPQYKFYYSLALLALCLNTTSQTNIKTVMEKVEDNQKQLKEWATHAPVNNQHKYELVEAEKARFLGQALVAMEHYDRAIQGAHNSGYIHEEALAYECAAEFYLSLGRNEFASLYMTKAHYGYRCWGAGAKFKDLELKYPELIAKISTHSQVGFTSNTITTSTIN